MKCGWCESIWAMTGTWNCPRHGAVFAIIQPKPEPVTGCPRNETCGMTLPGGLK